MNKTSIHIIKEFLNGATEGVSGSPSMPGNVKIENNQLYHYRTPIFERTDAGYILNMTRYSVQTGNLQKRIAEICATENVDVKTVTKVQREYSGTLMDFC